MNEHLYMARKNVQTKPHVFTSVMKKNMMTPKPYQARHKPIDESNLKKKIKGKKEENKNQKTPEKKKKKKERKGPNVSV